MNVSIQPISAAFSGPEFEVVIRMQMPDPTSPLNGVDFGTLHSMQDPDWLICYGDFAQPVATHVPKSRRLLIVTEPRSIKLLSRAFLDQFGVIVGPIPYTSRFATRILGQSGLTWFYPTREITATSVRLSHDFRQLEDSPLLPKENAVSVVISRKTRTRMHRQRLKFVEALEKAIGSRLKIFGSGFNPIDAKSDAIDPFSFHLALENNSIPHFWTEKIADAYLGRAFPIYSGCANIADYFPDDSVMTIDTADVHLSVSRIAALLDKGLQDHQMAALTEARRRLLHEHSLLAMTSRTIAALAPNLGKKRLSSAASLLPSKKLKRISDVIGQVWERLID